MNQEEDSLWEPGNIKQREISELLGLKKFESRGV